MSETCTITNTTQQSIASNSGRAAPKVAHSQHHSSYNAQLHPAYGMPQNGAQYPLPAYGFVAPTSYPPRNDPASVSYYRNDPYQRQHAPAMAQQQLCGNQPQQAPHPRTPILAPQPTSETSLHPYGSNPDPIAPDESYMYYNGSDGSVPFDDDRYSTLSTCYRQPREGEDGASCGVDTEDVGSCVSTLYSTTGFSVHPRTRRSSSTAVGNCLGHVDERYAEGPPNYPHAATPIADDQFDVDDCDTTGQFCFRNKQRAQQYLQPLACFPPPQTAHGVAPHAHGSLPPPPPPPPPARGPGKQRAGDLAASRPPMQFDSTLLLADSSTVAHTDLNGFCRYLAFPSPADIAAALKDMVQPKVANLPSEACNAMDGDAPPGSAEQTNISTNAPPPPPPTPNIPIFFGQVLFSTTREQLTWLIFQLSGVAPSIVTNHSPGCFTCYFKSPAECGQVLQLNKRVLFDRSGVWIAGTPEEVQLLYVTALAHNHSSSSSTSTTSISQASSVKLPKGPLVVETPMHKGFSSLPRGGRGNFVDPSRTYGGAPARATHAGAPPPPFGYPMGRHKAPKSNQRMH